MTAPGAKGSNTDATAYMTRQLEDREVPAAEQRMQCRRYVRIGGCDARYGVRLRWDMLCRRHPRWAVPLGQQQLTVLPGQQALSRCDTCQRWHRPTSATMEEGIRCSTLITPSLRKVRKRVLRAVEQEASGDRRQGTTTSPVTTQQVLNFRWRRQSAGTTKAALGLMRRMVLHDDIKKDKRTGG